MITTDTTETTFTRTNELHELRTPNLTSYMNTLCQTVNFVCDNESQKIFEFGKETCHLKSIIIWKNGQ